MPNYNISVVVDPSSAAAGVNVVENNLDRIPKKARQVQDAIQRAFDFNEADAVNGISAVDRALQATATDAAKAAAALNTVGSKSAEAANAMTRNSTRMVNSAGQVRQSQISLGQQFNDFSTQVLAGGSVVTAFAQQSGQAAYAMQGMNGALGTVGRFLAGPWGTILIIATTVLAGLLAKVLETNSGLDAQVNKLRQDAHEADLTRQAHVKFAESADGVREAVRKMNEELDKSTTSQRQQEAATLAAAKANLEKTVAVRKQIQAELELRLELQKGGAGAVSEFDTGAAMAQTSGIIAAQNALTQNQAAIAETEKAVREANVAPAVRLAEELSTPLGRINRQYDIMRDSAIAAAKSSDALTTSLAAQLTQIERNRQAAITSQRGSGAASSRAATAADATSDFIQGLVDAAVAKEDDTIAGKVQKALADFRRRFDRDPTSNESSRITQAVSDAAAAAAKDKQDKADEAARDFIQSVVDGANTRGQGTDQASVTSTAIEKQIADFERRFNRGVTAGEKETITKAFTEADARETAQAFKIAYIDPLERLQALQGKVGLDREILNKQLTETARLGRELTPVEKEQIDNGVRQGDQLERQAAILAQVRAPLQEYADTIAALNALLERGDINQTNFNSRVGQLGQTARDAISNLPGLDPNTGQSYSDLAATGNENARYAKEQEDLQNNRAQLLALGISWNALEEAAYKRHVDNLDRIDQARHSVALTAAASTFDSLAEIAATGFGKQTAIYKATFAISKAFAIADSIVKIQQGIANAMSLPFPANLAAAATVAATAASIVSDIQSVSLSLADGGPVHGAGGSRSDSIRANLSNGEYVVNAQATAANRPLLDAINSGRRPAANSNRGGGEGLTISIGDIIIQGSSGDGQQIGQDVKKVIQGIVRDELGTQSRSGGALTKSRSSVMSG